ncbi:MAG: cation transporter [Bradymonadales bacterium]|nr:MAG: cation transporter [Bradymonadales bacterium]
MGLLHPHDHPQHPDGGARNRAFRGLKIAFGISLSLVVIEVLGAFWSGSLALFADALHVASDVFALGAALLAGYLAPRLKSERQSYGFYRIEILAALLNGSILLGMSFFIIFKAISRWGQDAQVEGGLMLAVASFGLLANLLMLKVMRAGGLKNLNVRAAFLHVIGDTISSVTVIIGAMGVIILSSSWPDLIASLLVSGILLVMSVRLSLEALNVLMEGAPAHIDPKEVKESLINNFSEIKAIHDFHIWEITSHLFAMTAHIEAQVQSLEDTTKLIDRINLWVKARYGSGHTTFQIEPISRPNECSS